MSTTTKTAGLVMIGEFGFSDGSTGAMYAKPANYTIVKATWDEIDEDDLSHNAIQPTIDAGGIWIPDVK